MIYSTIYDENLLEKLAPKIILLSPRKKIILKVLEELIKKHLIENIKYLVFLDRIDEMSEEELDIVAEEMHIDFYDYTLSIDKKREACKSSFAIHSIKGTPSAIKKILNMFFKDSKLQQWYEYDGTPGRFKVQVKGVAPYNLSEITEKIENSKKKSQHLEKLEFLAGNELLLKPVFLGIQSQNHIINNETFVMNLRL